MTATWLATTWFLAVVAVAAVARTYVFCVRPMLGQRGAPRGCCCPTGSASLRPDLDADADLTAQLAQLRIELQALRMPSPPQWAGARVDAGRT